MAAGPELTKGKSLEGIEDVESYASGLSNTRNTTIEISNFTNVELGEMNNFNQAGHTIIAPPESIGPFTKEVVSYGKTDGSVVGCSGLLSYRLDKNYRLIIMYEQPYSYFLRDYNYIGLAIMDESTPTNQARFDDMFSGSGYDGTNTDRRRETTSGVPTVNVKKDGWRVTGTMNNESHGLFRIKIQNENQEFRTSQGLGGQPGVVYVFDPPTNVYL